MGVDSIGEVKATAATLGTGNDKEVREAFHVETEKGLGAFCIPRLFDSAAVSAHRPLE